MPRFEEADDPRRRTLIQALTLGLFSGAIPAGAWAADFFGSSPSRLPSGQSIYRIFGDVTVNGSAANLQTKISANDTVKTGKDSEIVFVVGGNSMILHGNSHVVLKGEDKESESFVISALRLFTGKLLSVSRHKGTAISTPTATIGIRGTGYYIEADPELTYFCTCYGLTDVTATNDPSSKDTVAATHHDKPLYIGSGAQSGKNIRRAGFKNHTDQELMLIESLVGRTPPFVFPGTEYSAPRREY
jgi:hypothetical protein